MFQNTLKVNISGHFSGLPPSRTDRPQAMDYLMVWVLRGRFDLTLADRHYVGGPGDLFTMAPGEPEHYWSEDSHTWEWLWVHYDGPAAAEATRRIRAHGGPRVHLGLDEHIRERFLELVIASPPGRPGARATEEALVADSCLASLFGLILDRLDRRHRLGATASGNGSDAPSFDAAAFQRYVHTHLTEPLTVEELAAHAKLSPAHFSRLVKQALGVSPMQYVIRRRVDRAATLLTQTPMKLAAIAAAVGYDDPYYFSRIFKKVTGVSPDTYRRNQ